jgi:hypothetical protein
MVLMIKNKKINHEFSVSEIKFELNSKGWSNRTLSQHWNCTEEYISKLINNENRRQWFNDAIFGLPDLTELMDARK